MAGLKSEQEVRGLLSRKLARGYAEHVAGVREEWPCKIPLGRPTKQAILSGFDEVLLLTQTLRSWERDLGVVVEYEMREAGGMQRIPARITVPSIDVAARLATPRNGERWEHILNRTRLRTSQAQESFPNLDPVTIAKVVRAQDTSDDLEFELLLVAAAWFRTHDAAGLTSREVPLPGIDGKWLGNARRRSLICLLAGKEDLGLVRMPASLEFSYVDPVHLAGGGRRYDSWVAGDVAMPAYEPSIVIIVENKETYLKFPLLSGGVCVFGSGRAGMALAGILPWVVNASRVVYWGDLDADGFEILDAYRARGIVCQSILMDKATLLEFERYGTNLEKDHKTAIHRERKELAHLTNREREAYELITSEDYTGNRRIEQERIPLDEALRALAPRPN